MHNATLNPIQFHATQRNSMELQFHAKNGVEWRALVRSGLAELDLDWNCHSQLELEWRVVRPTAGRQDWDGVAWHPEVI